MADVDVQQANRQLAQFGQGLQHLAGDQMEAARAGRQLEVAADAETFGLTEAIADYNTRLRITVDKVWTTPGAE